ncbi:hypothetical protein Ddc_13960 [Ditylenchus destructor]|nr:hypothetical protein Ddc_13960 [Ditylenchus destructor]
MNSSAPSLTRPLSVYSIENFFSDHSATNSIEYDSTDTSVSDEEIEEVHHEDQDENECHETSEDHCEQTGDLRNDTGTDSAVRFRSSGKHCLEL